MFSNKDLKNLIIPQSSGSLTEASWDRLCRLVLSAPYRRNDRVEEVAEVMGELIKEGKIRGWGQSQATEDQIRTVAALPAYQAVGPLPLRRGHAVGGTVRPVFQRRQMLIGLFLHAVPPFFFGLPFSPKRLPASSSQAVYRSFRRRRQNSLTPLLWSRCPEAGSRRTSPAGVFLFRRSFGFQGACSLMNYPKSTLF